MTEPENRASTSPFPRPAAASRALRDAAGRAARRGLGEREIAVLLRCPPSEAPALVAESAPLDAAGRPRVWMTARSAVAAISRELAADDEVMALRMLLQARDHLRALTHPDDIAEWLVTPAPLADTHWDTFLAAVTARTLSEKAVPAPAWARGLRPLRHEWVLAAFPSRYERTKAATPPDLAALNIFITDNDLTTY